MAHRDFLEQPETLRSPFFGSLALHGIVLSLLVFYSVTGAGRSREIWGTPGGLGGGAVARIDAVASIPMPAKTGPRNPVANDSTSNVPLPPKAQKAAQKAVKASKADENALPIRARKSPKRQSEMAASTQQFRPDSWHDSNKVTSTAGGALSSEMFRAPSGTGNVGFGSNAMGSRFGYYSNLVLQRIGEKWNTTGAPQLATPVIVTFDILRSGQTKNIKVYQSSGNPTLDNSALRAVYEASPFDPLPGGFSGNQVDVELWFYVKK